MVMNGDCCKVVIAGNEGEDLLQVTCSAAVCFFGLLAAFRRKLPSLQVRVASGPACLTGLLWSIGNFLSIYAVQVCLLISYAVREQMCSLKAVCGIAQRHASVSVLPGAACEFWHLQPQQATPGV